MKLADLLHPLPVGQFLTEHFGARPLVLQHNPARLAALSGDPPDALALQRLERDLERALAVPVSFAPPGEAPPTDFATVERDRLLLQLHGESGLSLAADETALRDQHALQPGDLAYLPRGCWAATEPRHGQMLAITIHNPTGRDFLDWLAGKLKNQPLLDRDLPRFAALDVQAAYQAEFRRLVVRMCRAPALLPMYTDRAAGFAPPRRPLPATAVDGRQIDILVRHGLQMKRLDLETLLVRFHGKELRFPIDVAEVLAFLEDHAPISLHTLHAAFAEDFDLDELAEFIAVLEQEGIVAIIGGDPAHD